jgi:hypothetical protein
MAQAPRRAGPPRTGGGDERAAASLTGGGPSQLGVDSSMRARDVSRPTSEDVTAAERLVQVSYRPRSHPRPALPGVTASPAVAPQPDAAPGSGGSSPDAS